ncbi:hypothetical protein PV08_09968 [Exophiala spinifera]|uniref:Uncharacterized protein n=1 Tax=Exophiala spinifera TaxID=91928 RepID=A0A0D2B258_9EURO|nr:uncharacterized protein PV08_09968 [Exophiala spinifera]KIW12690.1 hypothetical protein PV08_09968 [Exophiala spinifera]
MSLVWVSHSGSGHRHPSARKIINSHAAQIGRDKHRERLAHTTEDAAVVRRKKKPRKGDDSEGNERNKVLPVWENTSPLSNQIGMSFLVPLASRVTEVLPHDGLVLGLSKAQTAMYGRELLGRAYQNEVFLLGLALYRLCALPLSKMPGSGTRNIIDTMRARFINLINSKLAYRAINDTLIHSICCATPVDEHLGLLEYSVAHLRGLEALVELRGGFSQVGSSYGPLADTLQSSVLHAITTTKLNIKRDGQPQTPIASEQSTPKDHIIELRCPIPGCLTPFYGENTELPEGFAELAAMDALSLPMCHIIRDFQRWLHNLPVDKADECASWRHQIPDNLSNLEKCIYLALSCLADDLSAVGVHVCMDLWRKPRPRAIQILHETTLWEVPKFADCLLWVATSVSLANDLVPYDIWEQLQDKILASRPDIVAIDDIVLILQGFFAPEKRLRIWRSRWEGRLLRPW